MTRESEPRNPKVSLDKPSKAPIDVVEFSSAQGLEGKLRIIIGDRIKPEIVDIPENQGALRIKDGAIQLDKKALKKETKGVENWLKMGVEDGNEKVFEVYLRNIRELDEGTEDAESLLRKAFERKNSELALNALHIKAVTGGIAERNIIREGLQSELPNYPFSYKDKNGQELDIEEDLDIVLVKDRNQKLKFVVGSQKGINSIVLPQELPANKFQPDLTKVDKDPVTEAITIPLKAAKSGKQPSVEIIEIRKGAINVLEQLAKEEEKAKNERAKKRKEQRSSPPVYTPPTPRRGSGYISYSG